MDDKEEKYHLQLQIASISVGPRDPPYILLAKISIFFLYLPVLYKYRAPSADKFVSGFKLSLVQFRKVQV